MGRTRPAEGEQAAGDLEQRSPPSGAAPGSAPAPPAPARRATARRSPARPATSWSAGGLGLRRPLRRLRAHGVGAQVHDHRQQVGARDAVDQRVVRLGQHGPAPVLEALDHPDLPERLGAVELLGHHPADQLAELALAARGGQRGVAQVVLDVEVRVVDPDRTPQLEGDEADLLAVARDQVELGVHHGDDVAEGRRRTLEDGHRGDVHVGHVVLDVEERRVQRAQAIRTHRPSLHGHPLERSATPGRSGASRVSRRSRGGERAAQRRPARAVARISSPGLLVGGFDHLRATVLGHGPQPHGPARLGAGLQADHHDAGLLEAGRSRAPCGGARSAGASRRPRWRCRGRPTWTR